jgi:osmotically inducible protein OsmC
MPTRSASANWTGTLKGGKGNFKAAGGLGGPYTFATRFEDAAGGVNPEDLLAAAEASCFSMALSGGLEKNGTPPTSIDTNARCTVERVEGGMAITTMDLDVRANVPNIDDATFQKIAAATKDGCPVSKALKGNVNITLKATLAR